MDDKEYIESEFNKVLTSSHDDSTYRLKVNGDREDTKWISINRTQLLNVVKVLSNE